MDSSVLGGANGNVPLLGGEKNCVLSTERHGEQKKRLGFSLGEWAALRLFAAIYQGI